MSSCSRRCSRQIKRRSDGGKVVGGTGGEVEEGGEELKREREDEGRGSKVVQWVARRKKEVIR